jgi:hypothetical protein
VFKDLTLTRLRRLAATSSTSKTCKRFARLGTAGKYKNNMYRDLMSLLKKQGCVEPMYIKTPLKTRAGLVKETLWPCLPPHELYAESVSRGLIEMVLTGGIDLAAFGTAFARMIPMDSLVFLLMLPRRRRQHPMSL